jgi:hypothetical protein
MVDSVRFSGWIIGQFHDIMTSNVAVGNSWKVAACESVVCDNKRKTWIKVALDLLQTFLAKKKNKCI